MGTYTYQVFQPNGTKTSGSVMWADGPNLGNIKAVVQPLINGEPMEHVAVLHEGKRADMFVTEVGHIRWSSREPLPRNDAATAIYRNNWLTQNPGTDPETLPWIAGVAVLFDRIVWK